MTSARAQQVVLTSALVSVSGVGGQAFLPEKYGGKGELPSPRIVIGTAIAFTFLAILASFVPMFAAAWAWLILTVVMLNTVGPILGKVFNER